MKKLMYLILGFIIGATTFTALPINAAVEEYILQKADYKVEIFGKEYIDEKNPILTLNGTTYAPLRSMLNAAGLEIGWDETKGIASVNNKSSVSGSNNFLDTHYYLMDIMKQYPNYKFDDWDKASSTIKLYRINNNEKVLVSDSIPYVLYNEKIYFTPQVYKTKILPFIRN